ncbi:MAG: CsgG/HfaB family protein, partial [bacterium]|nr:CsgG/HfaB family protein [bacterium]
MKIHHFILFIVGFVVFGCASNRYMVADKLLEQEDYTKALKEYVGLAKVDGSLNLSRDVRGLTGAMISYYGLGKYKNSFAISKRILSLDTYNSSAIFYAGLNLEKTEKYSLAKRIYRYYEFLPQNNPYYDFIKSRFRLMVEKEMATRAKMAVQMEKSVGMGQVVDNTLAVLYFVNILEDPRWNVISKGIAEMMITDFSQVEKLTVIERVQLQKLVEEIGLGMSGMVDDSTAPRMGKLMRAKNLVHGSFSVKAGRNLIMNADVIDVKAEQNLGGDEYSGELKEILELEKKIVFNTLASLN